MTAHNTTQLGRAAAESLARNFVSTLEEMGHLDLEVTEMQTNESTSFLPAGSMVATADFHGPPRGFIAVSMDPVQLRSLVIGSDSYEIGDHTEELLIEAVHTAGNLLLPSLTTTGELPELFTPRVIYGQMSFPAVRIFDLNVTATDLKFGVHVGVNTARTEIQRRSERLRNDNEALAQDNRDLHESSHDVAHELAATVQKQRALIDRISHGEGALTHDSEANVEQLERSTRQLEEIVAGILQRAA